jgi:hypothetical protein
MAQLRRAFSWPVLRSERAERAGCPARAERAVLTTRRGYTRNLLNGASSSGKTTLARALQRELATPFLYFSSGSLGGGERAARGGPDGDDGALGVADRASPLLRRLSPRQRRAGRRRQLPPGRQGFDRATQNPRGRSAPCRAGATLAQSSSSDASAPSSASDCGLATAAQQAAPACAHPSLELAGKLGLRCSRRGARRLARRPSAHLPSLSYWAGPTISLPSSVTAVCASSRPSTEAPVFNVAAVWVNTTPTR